MQHTIERKNSIFRFMVVFLTILAVFTLSGCEGGLDYSDFKDDHLDTWEFTLDQDQRQYLVYFYGPRCGFCNDIKQDVLGFAQDNNADLAVFFISSDEAFDREDFPITHPTTGKAITGTPTILVVKDGVLRDMYSGSTPITDLLNKINEGSYAIIE